MKLHRRVVHGLMVTCLAFASVTVTAGMFDAQTCRNSEGFAKRVFYAREAGQSYASYRKIEGPADSGPAGQMVEAIERGIFRNSKINTVDKAVQYAYSVCITWK